MIMLATRLKSTPPVLSLPFDWAPAPRELTTDDVAQLQYRTELWHLTQQVMDELRRRGIEPISAYLNDLDAPDEIEVAVLVHLREVSRPDFANIYDFTLDLSLSWQAKHAESYLLYRLFGIDETFDELALIADGFYYRMTESTHESAESPA